MMERFFPAEKFTIGDDALNLRFLTPLSSIHSAVKTKDSLLFMFIFGFNTDPKKRTLPKVTHDGMICPAEMI